MLRATAALLLMLWAAPVWAQIAPQSPTQSPVPTTNQDEDNERVQIGLSTDRITITSDFSGADLTIFGAVDGVDPQVSRLGGYDVIVVLEGPASPVTVWRRKRVLGVWINAQSLSFVSVPLSYSVATTRVFQDITDQTSYKRLSLGAASIHLEPEDREADPATIQEFTAALRERKLAIGLYTENVGGVQFLSQTLFRAILRLPADVPVGTHKARAFLFKNGNFVMETSSQLAIVKAGFEQRVYNYAHQYSFYYGIFAVALAMVTGWLGRLLFRRD